MQTVLITGANGFVGHYLTSRLLTSGYRVVACGQGPSRLQITHPNFVYESLDISAAEAVRELVGSVRPGLIVHGAAMTKPDECEQHQERAQVVNVGGTANLLAAADSFHPFFLHISTDFIFAGTAQRYSEEDEGSPVNYYGQTKWEAEQLVRRYAGNWAIVRPILLYGNPQAGRSNILTFVADRLRNGQPVRLFTDQLRFPTYVEDLVWGITQILKRQHQGIFHFSGKDQLSPYDMGLAVAAHLGLDPALVEPVTETSFFQPAKRPPQTLFDCTKAKAILGYQPTSFEEGLRKTFSHESAAG